MMNADERLQNLENELLDNQDVTAALQEKMNNILQSLYDLRNSLATSSVTGSAHPPSDSTDHVGSVKT